MQTSIKKIICALSIVTISFSLTACSQKSSIPKLPESMKKIGCISREEGSGTRDMFEQLINTSSKGTVQLAMSSDEVNSFVSEDINNIGYSAFSKEELPDSTKYCSVDNISLNDKTIKSGKYPLIRNYYRAGYL